MKWKKEANFSILLLILTLQDKHSSPLSPSITFTLMIATAVVAEKFEWLQHTMQLNHITNIMHKILKNFTPVN
jgi:hypothetical protein